MHPMNPQRFAVLAWHEIAEHRLMLGTAALVGWIPLAAPYLPGAERFPAVDLRMAVTATLAVLFGGAVLLIAGASLLSRDLAEGRAGFYFSRPIPGWLLWTAKMTGAWAVGVLTVVLLVGPAAVLDSDRWLGLGPDVDTTFSRTALPLLAPQEIYLMHWTRQALPAPLPPVLRGLAALAAVLVVLLAVHTLSTIVRARSAWMLFDLAGLVAVAGLVWSVRAVLVEQKALGPLVWAERWLALAAVVALALAGAAQVGRGRVELRRGHRYLSLTLWSLLIAAASIAGLGSLWAVALDIDDIDHLKHTVVAPQGAWLGVGGIARHRAGTGATFLIDAATGRRLHLGPLDGIVDTLTFSGDGSTAVWADCHYLLAISCEVYSVDLTSPEPTPRRVDIEVRDSEVRWALSRDGGRMALYQGRQLTVHELASGAVLAAAAATDWINAISFVSADRIRFHHTREGEAGRLKTIIQHLDVAGGKLSEDGEMPDLLEGHWVLRNPFRDTIFYATLFPRRFGFRRADTGEVLKEHPADDLFPSFLRFLSDGRVVLGAWRPERGLRLAVLAADGTEERHLERPHAQRPVFGGEIAPGRMLLAFREGVAEAGEPWLADLGLEPLPGWATYELDAATGTLTLLARGVTPLVGTRHDQPAPGSPATRLFAAGSDAIVWWDPSAGEARVVAGPFSNRP